MSYSYTCSSLLYIQAFDLSDGRKRISGARKRRRRPKVLNRGTAFCSRWGQQRVLLRVSFAAKGAIWRGGGCGAEPADIRRLLLALPASASSASWQNASAELQRSFSGAGGGRSSTAQRPRRRRRQHTTLFVRVGGSSGFCCVFHLRGTEPATADGWGRGIHRAQCGGKNCK